MKSLLKITACFVLVSIVTVVAMADPGTNTPTNANARAHVYDYQWPAGCGPRGHLTIIPKEQADQLKQMVATYLNLTNDLDRTIILNFQTNGTIRAISR